MKPAYTPDAVVARENARNETLKRSQAVQSSMHLLLGLIRDHQSPAAVALREMGIHIPELETTLVRRLNARPLGKAGEEFRLSVECNDVERDCVIEALRLGRNYVNSAHMLLSILRHSASPGAKMLAEFGITLAEARETVERLELANSR